MSSAHNANAGVNSWGVLINPDKSPTPLLEQLCLGIAQLMVKFDEYATTDLTPDRMAAFYRKVGGNYDVLFLETKPSALSFIYQRLGCFHSIQPSNDPFKPPSIPALQPNGFVRWQTIQLLLDPDEHAQYLRNAVSLWDIKNPNGGVFPKTIPRDAFPAEPDPEMVEWHEGVSRRFEFDYWRKNVQRSSPPNFHTYHSVFNQKDASSEQEDHRHMDAESRHTQRRSAEYRPSTRRVKSTNFPRAEDEPEFVSPRAPSPPLRRQSTRTRGRERAKSFATANSKLPPGQDTSDASSEGSGTPTHPQPQTNRPRRNLSPPHPSHTRRHSHEAYARRPNRDVSADAHRRHTYRETPTAGPSPGRGAGPTRQYDSDSARRKPRTYEDLPPRSNIRFREPVFHDPRIYTLHPHETYRRHSTDYIDRGSYRGAYRARVSQTQSGGGGKRCPVSVVDMEYPAPSGRRSVYER